MAVIMVSCAPNRLRHSGPSARLALRQILHVPRALRLSAGRHRHSDAGIGCSALVRRASAAAGSAGAQAASSRPPTWNRLVVKTAKMPLARAVWLTPGRALKVKCTSAKQVWPAGQAVSSPPAACCTADAGVSMAGLCQLEEGGGLVPVSCSASG